MRTSIKGLVAIAKSEGIVPAPYLDPVGVWTFGIGHTAMSGDPDPEKMPRGMPEDVDAAIRYAVSLFQKHIQKYEQEVSRAVTVPLQQHEFDALVSFHFNTGAIFKASATDALNRGDKEDAARRLTLYNKGRVNGQLVQLEGLVRRREEERRMFLFGNYPSEGITIWKVNANNKYSQALRIMSPDEMEQLLADHPADAFFAPEAEEAMGLIERLFSLFRR